MCRERRLGRVEPRLVFERHDPTAARADARRTIVLLGIVSLFADMTYEGARSLAGPYLAVLGASGTAVGLIAGGGELLGYLVRFIAGRFSDATRRYWAIAGVGYFVNLAAVPLLSIVRSWVPAAGLLVAERLGKGIRTPARDVLLAGAAEDVGVGWGFGLHEALDGVGGVAGPLLLAVLIGSAAEYRQAFAWLALPAFASLLALAIARRYGGSHARGYRATPPPPRTGLGPGFRLYMAATALLALGFADFPLIAYRFQDAAVLPARAIPLTYAFAMLTSIGAALAFGRWFDRRGLIVFAPIVLVGLPAAPLVFMGGRAAAFAGMGLWGIGMGAHQSVGRAAVSRMAPPERRGSAYGTFNAVYGVAWFVGSALLGVLYDRTLIGLVLAAVGAQALAVPLLAVAARRQRA